MIEADELASSLATPDAPVLLDVRWKLGDPDGYRHYLREHIPGAVYADLERELAGPPSPAHGRHPLPVVADLERAARGWGVREGVGVVAYDDVGGTSAARVWWLLRWAGFFHVRLLDGGLGSWKRAGLPLRAGEVRPGPGNVRLSEGRLPVIDADGAAQYAGNAVLLDARAAERYRGEVEPVDPRAGHIPGARSAPTTQNLAADGSFRPVEELRARFAELGADGRQPVGVYCGSSVTAAHEVAALAIAGIEAALYPGSWSQWSSDPDRPVETGHGRS
ncbi:sulfurtransferase [Phytoactinopolyspora alkaliphila]|uniref:Sulfurtransferase n=1 Tax=Phytoactinopolyspora alkaliphila TaxID=1783498 RepID=A0A6N9YTX5_9ACTN|nr:sulfurtransferase [Phytoactinopolyspora alkaliphila]NED98425.1 sulfurtransferase [Phytoactinopolyspora alkaliphila]